MYLRLSGSRCAFAVMGVTLLALVLPASPAFAGYRAWYAPWDYVGDSTSPPTTARTG